MRLFGIEFRSRKQERAITASSLPTAWRNAIGTHTNGFGSLPVVFGCVRLISSRLADLPLRVLDANGKQQQTPTWLKQPNEHTTAAQLVAGMAWSLLIDGNAFVIPLRNEAGQIAQLVLAHPTQVTVRAESTELGAALKYYLVGQELPEVLHAKYIPVPSETRGVGPIGAAQVAIQSGLASQQFVLDQFVRAGTFNYALITKSQLDDTAKQALAAQLLNRHHGAANAYQPLVLDGEVGIQQLSITPQQAQFLELSTWTAATIAGQIFGVDPTLLAIQQQGTTLTYSNALDRERNLWADAVKPLARTIETALSALLPDNLKADLDEQQMLLGSPHDRAALGRTLANINKAHATPDDTMPVFTAAEIRQVLGYQPDIS